MDCCSNFFRKRRSINRDSRPVPIIIPKSKIPCDDWWNGADIVCDLSEYKLQTIDESRKNTLDSNISITVETQLE